MVISGISRCVFELVNGWTPLIRSSLSGHRRQRSARLVRPWGNAQQPAVLRPRHGTLLSGSAGVGAWGGAWRVAIATAFRPLVVTIGAHDSADTAVLLQHRARPDLAQIRQSTSASTERARAQAESCDPEMSEERGPYHGRGGRLLQRRLDLPRRRRHGPQDLTRHPREPRHCLHTCTQR